MIPKIIHYCWFGRNPLPKDAKRCIDSWRKYCPEYKIIEWNEDNFDFSQCRYAREAYEEKKWAFVSDYARFRIIYDNGGIYFDTDVELIKKIDDIINDGAYMGFEREGCVAPGLGIGAEAKNPIYKEIIDYYESISFKNPDDSNNYKTVVAYTSDVLRKYGLANENRIQTISGITFYPTDFFCPLNPQTGKIVITENTRSIHHYTDSWHTSRERLKKKIQKIFGKKITKWVVYLKQHLRNKKYTP